jgi:hypothetical protein
MNRAAKITLLSVVGVVGVIVAAIVAGLIWLTTVKLAYDYKWGWLEVPVHYRLTFGVEVGGVAYSGSTVVEVTYQQIPQWQMMSQPGIAAIYRGQAGCAKFSDGKMLCLMPAAEYPVYGKDRRSVSAIAARLLSVNGSPTGPKTKWNGIYAWNATTVAGRSDIPIELLSQMIVLDDPANPSSAHLFDPEHPERSLGPGAHFLGAQIAVTNEPISHDIQSLLPWLADPAIPQQLSHPGDPILQENHGEPLFKAYFY